MTDLVDGAGAERADVLHRLRLMAAWVEPEEEAEPELQIFASAAREIERLRGRIERITQLAQSASLLS